MSVAWLQGGLRLLDHEPVGHSNHVCLSDHRVPIPLIEVYVSHSSVSTAGLAAGVQPEAVLVHDPAAYSATLEMRVNREGTKMGVRLIGVVLAPGSEPFADAGGRAGPRTAIRFGKDLSRWIWLAGWHVPAGAIPVTATSLPPWSASRRRAPKTRNTWSRFAQSERRRRSGSVP